MLSVNAIKVLGNYFGGVFVYMDSSLPSLPLIKGQNKEYLKISLGTSLVAQWLRIRLPVQGTRVQSLVQEDPACRGATKPMHHNYWAREPQLLKPAHLEPVLPNKRSHNSEKPVHCSITTMKIKYLRYDAFITIPLERKYLSSIMQTLWLYLYWVFLKY